MSRCRLIGGMVSFQAALGAFGICVAVFRTGGRYRNGLEVVLGTDVQGKFTHLQYVTALILRDLQLEVLIRLFRLGIEGKVVCRVVFVFQNVVVGDAVDRFPGLRIDTRV